MSSRPGWLALRILFFAQLRQQPARLAIMVVVIALGVALGTSVFLVNATAVDEFTAASRRLVGEADVVIRGSGDGFDESLYPQLARDPRVRIASPVLEVMAPVPGRQRPLHIIGIDMFRAAVLQPELLADIGSGNVRSLFAANGIWLSHPAAQELSLSAGDEFSVTVGNRMRTLKVLGVMSGKSYPQAAGLMDIASAQWTFARLGRLNRLDLALEPGTRVAVFMASLSPSLPAGVAAIPAAVETSRAAGATRAYRVNLNMLALVALLTAGFLVFSIQSLAMLRRRQSIALMRALGFARSQVQIGLLGEGLLIGALASLLGVAIGALLASIVVHWLEGNLGNMQLRLRGAWPQWHALAMIAAMLIGTLATCAATALPAWHAARRDPARGLRSGDVAEDARPRRGIIPGLAMVLGGTALLAFPAVHGLPVAGYLSVALLLFGTVMWIPGFTRLFLARLPDMRPGEWRLALAQLRGNPHTVFLSLVPIIVSFAFMVSMVVMVHSFRQSFGHWLDRMLPADIQVRLPAGSDTAAWDQAAQRAVAGLPGVAGAQFRRTRTVILQAGSPPVTLIARDMQSDQPARILPLVTAGPISRNAVWVSEALADRYSLRTGQHMTIPVVDRVFTFTIAGIWRDYAHGEGAMVIDRTLYEDLSRDVSANEGSVQLAPGADADLAIRSIRHSLDAGGALEIRSSTDIKRRSLGIFDRAFAVTYALEILAVVLGLTGISVAASFAAIARRSEFAMLRHIGMLKRQILALLATQGLISASVGVACGLALGLVLSLVLVFVINRQSFNWSIDLVLPVQQLFVIASILIGASALAALVSGRHALSEDAIRAVREDW